MTTNDKRNRFGDYSYGDPVSAVLASRIHWPRTEMRRSKGIGKPKGGQARAVTGRKPRKAAGFTY